MNNKHTLAPWKVNHRKENTVEITGNKLNWNKHCDREICTLFGATDRLDEIDELKANARLISAAPDMLEALQNLENDDNSIPAHAWKMVQDAIKKATI
jgi:hypothetical protein